MHDTDPDPAAILRREDPQLPLSLAESFASLCRPPSLDDLAVFGARLRLRRLQLLALAERHEFDLETALAIADGLLAAIESAPALTDCQRLLVAGGVEYFLLLADEQPDLAGPEGFEDDRLAANAVFAAIGRPDLRVPANPRAYR